MKFINFEMQGERYLLTELPKGYTPTHLVPDRGWDGLSCIKEDGTVAITMLPEGEYQFIGAVKDIEDFNVDAYMPTKKYTDGNYALLKIL